MSKVLTQKAKQALRSYLNTQLETAWNFIKDNAVWTPQELNDASRNLQLTLSLPTDHDGDPGRTLSEVEIEFDLDDSYYYFEIFPYFTFPGYLADSIYNLRNRYFSLADKQLQATADAFNRGLARASFVNIDSPTAVHFNLKLTVRLSDDEVEEV